MPKVVGQGAQFSAATPELALARAKEVARSTSTDAVVVRDAAGVLWVYPIDELTAAEDLRGPAEKRLQGRDFSLALPKGATIQALVTGQDAQLNEVAVQDAAALHPRHLDLGTALRDYPEVRQAADKALQDIGRRLGFMSNAEPRLVMVRQAYDVAKRAFKSHDPEQLAQALSALDVALRTLDSKLSVVRGQAAAMQAGLERVFATQPATGATPATDGPQKLAQHMLETSLAHGKLLIAAIIADDHSGAFDHLGTLLTAGAVRRMHAGDAGDLVLRVSTAVWTVARDLRIGRLTAKDFGKTKLEAVDAEAIWKLARARLADKSFDAEAESQGLVRDPVWQKEGPTWPGEKGPVPLSFAALPSVIGRHLGDRRAYALERLDGPLGKALSDAMVHGTKTVPNTTGTLGAELQSYLRTAYAFYRGGGGQPPNASQALVGICRACHIDPIAKQQVIAEPTLVAAQKLGKLLGLPQVEQLPDGRFVAYRSKTGEEIAAEVEMRLSSIKLDEPVALDQLDAAKRAGKARDGLFWLDDEGRRALADMLDLRPPAKDFAPRLGPPPGRRLDERMAREKSDKAFNDFCSEIIVMAAVGLVSGGAGAVVARGARAAQLSARAVKVAQFAGSSASFTTGMGAVHGELHAKQYAIDGAMFGAFAVAARLAKLAVTLIPGESAAADVLRLAAQYGAGTAFGAEIGAVPQMIDQKLSGQSIEFGESFKESLKLVLVLQATHAAIGRLAPSERTTELQHDAEAAARKLTAHLEAIEQKLAADDHTGATPHIAGIPEMRRELGKLRRALAKLDPAAAAAIPDPEAPQKLTDKKASAVGPGRKGAPAPKGEHETNKVYTTADGLSFQRADDTTFVSSDRRVFAVTGNWSEAFVLVDAEGKHYVLDLTDGATLVPVREGYLGHKVSLCELVGINGEVHIVTPSGQVQTLKRQLVGVTAPPSEVTAGKPLELRARLDKAGVPRNEIERTGISDAEGFAPITLGDGSSAMASPSLVVFQDGRVLRWMPPDEPLQGQRGVYYDSESRAYIGEEKDGRRTFTPAGDGPLPADVGAPPPGERPYVLNGKLVYLEGKGLLFAVDALGRPQALVTLGLDGTVQPATLPPGKSVTLHRDYQELCAWGGPGGVEVGDFVGLDGTKRVVRTSTGEIRVLGQGGVEAPPATMLVAKGSQKSIRSGGEWFPVSASDAAEQVFVCIGEHGKSIVFGFSETPQGRVLAPLGRGSGTHAVFGSDHRAAIVHEGEVYRVVSAPENASALSDKVGKSLGSHAALTLRQRQVYEPLFALLESRYGFGRGEVKLPEKLAAMIHNEIVHGEPGMLREALGENAVQRLAEAEGVHSLDEQPFRYAVKSGSMEGDGGFRLDLSAHPDDLAIFRREGSAIRPVSIGEVEAHFKKAMAGTKGLWLSDLPRPDKVEIGERTHGGVRTRCLTVKRGKQELLIPIGERPKGVPATKLPTDPQLIAAMKRLPFDVLKSMRKLELVNGDQASADYAWDTGVVRFFTRESGWTNLDVKRVMAHEIGGHGVEQADPALYKLLFEAIKLDHATSGRGPTEEYGATNLAEAWATLIERYAAGDPTLPITRPHQFQLLSRIFETGGDLVGDPGRAHQIYASAMAAVMIAALGASSTD